MPNRSPNPEPLKADIHRSFRRRGLAGAAQAAWVLATVNTISRGRYSATRFRNGELTIIPGSLPVLELQLMKEEMRTTINKKLGQDFVRRIRVKQT